MSSHKNVRVRTKHTCMYMYMFIASIVSTTCILPHTHTHTHTDTGSAGALSEVGASERPPGATSKQLDQHMILTLQNLFIFEPHRSLTSPTSKPCSYSSTLFSCASKNWPLILCDHFLNRFFFFQSQAQEALDRIRSSTESEWKHKYEETSQEMRQQLGQAKSDRESLLAVAARYKVRREGEGGREGGRERHALHHQDSVDYLYLIVLVHGYRFLLVFCCQTNFSQRI